MLGFIDVFAIKEGRIVGVQATSGDNTSSRVAKIKAGAKGASLLDAGGKILVIGWRQKVARKRTVQKRNVLNGVPKVLRVRSTSLGH